MPHLSFLLLSLFVNFSLFAKPHDLERLLQGNERYVKDALEHPNRTSERREAVVSKQQPFAIIVGCADSRVSPEIIFDQGVGDLFVVRIAGNVIGPIELASIEYSAIYLHSSIILVLGHENCGAINAVIQGTTQDIEPIAQLIRPAVEEEKSKNPSNLLEATTKLHAIKMKDYLVQNPTIQKLISEGNIEAHAGYYHLETGAIELLDKSR